MRSWTWLARAVHQTHDAGGTWSDVGVLTRDNAHAAEVFDALTASGVPVEIVGLSGLLRLPEVAEVVATLQLLQDVTSNASLLTLLTGPRWAVGPRDLRLLGARAAELAGSRGRADSPATVEDHLVQIADGIDPAEIACLDRRARRPRPRRRTRPRPWTVRAPGRRAADAAVPRGRAAARHRAPDHRHHRCRRRAGLRDQRRAPARRDNLDLFVKGVADFQSVDGDVSLSALLAYLTAEDDQGNGLDVATPTAADSVKLLTVHRPRAWSGPRCSSWGCARTASRPTARGRSGRRRRPSSPHPAW